MLQCYIPLSLPLCSLPCSNRPLCPILVSCLVPVLIVLCFLSLLISLIRLTLLSLPIALCGCAHSFLSLLFLKCFSNFSFRSLWLTLLWANTLLTVALYEQIAALPSVSDYAACFLILAIPLLVPYLLFHSLHYPFALLFLLALSHSALTTTDAPSSCLALPIVFTILATLVLNPLSHT